jgi:hypothetical protein
MSVEKLLSGILVALAAIAVLVATIGLGHELITAPKVPDMYLHTIEEWVFTVGERLAIILIAAIGAIYLTKRK